MFSKIFQPYQGIIGHYLNSWFGMSPTINVLGNSKAALWGIMLANIWEWTGWSMIMYIGGISQISEDVKEAARIDGASEMQNFFYNVLPLAKPIFTSVILITFVNTWNEFLFSNTFLQDRDIRTVSLRFYNFVGSTNTEFGYVYAAALISMLPIVAIYLLTQNTFVEGMTSGSVKG